jgi:hypothetical protein
MEEAERAEQYFVPAGGPPKSGTDTHGPRLGYSTETGTDANNHLI